MSQKKKVKGKHYLPSDLVEMDQRRTKNLGARRNKRGGTPCHAGHQKAAKRRKGGGPRWIHESSLKPKPLPEGLTKISGPCSLVVPEKKKCRQKGAQVRRDSKHLSKKSWGKGKFQTPCEVRQASPPNRDRRSKKAGGSEPP